MDSLTITTYCPYCKQPGRVRFVPVEGESDRSEIVKCPSCKKSFDAFNWLASADKLAGRRLRRPTQVRFEPNG